MFNFRNFIHLLLLFFLTTGTLYAKAMPLEYDAGRNRLIAYMLSHQLPAQHFGHKPLDDDLSLSAFDLYIRQLDPRKRFLLKKDIQELQAFSKHVDEELRRGRIVLPDAGMSMLNERIKDVQEITLQLLNKGFEPNSDDQLEIDPKKRAYAQDKEELRVRWRRILKMQIINDYLDLLQKDNGEKDKKNRASILEQIIQKNEPLRQELWQQSMEKVGKRNKYYLRRLLQSTRQEHYDRYFDAVARAFDPHTNYMAPTSKEDFDIHMSGSLEGIGALLREDDGSIKVVRIIPGSAAERQGQLGAEDTILAVSEKDGDPVDMTEMRIREAVSFIRGPKGTEVRLTVQKPDGKTAIIPIIRDVVQIEETYVKSAVQKTPNGAKVGYVAIPSFYRDFESTRNGGKGRNVTDDLRRELHALKLEKINGLIVDLRNNGGGSLADAVDISGLFLPGGPVVQVKNSQGMVRILEDEDPNMVYDGPLVILVNKFSASASEILAAALQDYGRALVIGGPHTHGKGTVQALMDMNRNLPLLHLKKYEDLGALKVTIQKFYRINGKSTQFKGVEPDIVVPSILEFLESGEQYIDNSLPWDTVEAVDFTPWNGVRFDLGTIQKMSQVLVEQSKEFQEIKIESAKAKERSDKTMLSIDLRNMMMDRIEREKDIASAQAGDSLEHLAMDKSVDDKKEDKSLQEQIEDDPYVKMTLSLINNLATQNNTIGDIQ